MDILSPPRYTTPQIPYSGYPTPRRDVGPEIPYPSNGPGTRDTLTSIAFKGRNMEQALHEGSWQ